MKRAMPAVASEHIKRLEKMAPGFPDVVIKRTSYSVNHVQIDGHEAAIPAEVKDMTDVELFDWLADTVHQLRLDKYLAEETSFAQAA